MIFHNFTGFFSAKNIEDLIAESERMKRFNHQNVMGLIGVCIDVGERPFIVMPFMANGSLLTYLKKNRSQFTIAEDAGEKMVIKVSYYIIASYYFFFVIIRSKMPKESCSQCAFKFQRE